jgi:hypothetical protein
MKSFRSILLAAATMSPLAVFAHAGHGHENPLSPGHYLWNPEHALPLTLAVALIVVLFVVGKRMLQTRTKKEGRD